jgi:hypothetical protein
MTDKFSNSLPNNDDNLNAIFDAWDSIDAAEDYSSPIPVGKYVCILRKGELTQARSGTRSYKLTFEVADGEYKGRKLWSDIWLTSASLSLAKRDFAKLGITDPRTQLSKPVPKWLKCFVWAGIRTDDSGTERNTVTRFEVIEKITPEIDPFAPSEGGE